MKQPIHFTVDSHLLRELGERLVGRPHIALAELIKNSYDADATAVVIEFAEDAITVTDNGHGMTLDDFQSRWMRIGSTHKENERVSPRFARPLTGSKGVGRLAVQLLAEDLELRSRPASDPANELTARVDWTAAVEAGLLTTATADVDWRRRMTTKPKPTPTRLRPNDEGANDEGANDEGANDEGANDETDPGFDYQLFDTLHSGVSLRLTGLTEDWDAEAFTDLAREIWPLQPPFQGQAGDGFRVILKADNRDIVEGFRKQMTAILDLWTARLVGELLSAEESERLAGTVPSLTNPDTTTSPQASGRAVRLSLDVGGRAPETITYWLNECYLDRMKFEIRIFNLKRRQPFGISVGDARAYLNDYGGVHVYDAGFHLPYYGPDSDWLNIEQDHSHRRGASDYLPASLSVAGGAEYVPTNSRIYGTVEVSTSHEQARAEELARSRPIKRGQGRDRLRAKQLRRALRIQVTRDRLVDTLAYRNMRTMVRAAVDIYAMREAQRAYEQALNQRTTREPASRRVRDLATALEAYRPQIPPSVYEDLSRRVRETTQTIRADYEARHAQVGILASLATAGVSALAYEHEVGKQFLVLDDIAGEIRTVTPTPHRLEHVAGQLEDWVRRARSTRGLFAPLLDQENREVRTRLKARPTIQSVIDQVRPLGRGADIDARVSKDMRLPEGTFAEWSALFQNLLINAMNAVLETDERRICISDGSDGHTRYIWVQDTGYGIDLNLAPVLFRPFERASKVSHDRAELGLGGTGLGLTIVAMLCDELGCSIEFVEPDDEFSTCAQLSWEEG